MSSLSTSEIAPDTIAIVKAVLATMVELQKVRLVHVCV